MKTVATLMYGCYASRMLNESFFEAGVFILIALVCVAIEMIRQLW